MSQKTYEICKSNDDNGDWDGLTYIAIVKNVDETGYRYVQDLYEGPADVLATLLRKAHPDAAEEE